MIRVYQGLDHKWYVRWEIGHWIDGRFDTLEEALNHANNLIK